MSAFSFLAPDLAPLPARLDAVRTGLGDVPVIDDEAGLRRKSQDFFWFSPILKPQLENCRADLVVTPRTHEELIRTLSLCARHKVPLTVRGGGTGNYGQAVPLEGGVVLEMTEFCELVWSRPGVGRFQAGARMLDIDRALRPQGLELRCHPSTRAHATIGGFLAGGAGGVGSCTWGQLSDPGAVIAAQVLTLEEEPRLIELRDRDALKVMHAYGINGVVTEVEMPLAGAQPWAERILSFPSLGVAMDYAHALTAAEAIAKKLVSVHDGRIPPMIKRLRPLVPEGQAMVIVMVSEPQARAAEDMARDHGGSVVFARGAEESQAAAFEGAGQMPPIYEYAWNHTTLYAIKARPGTTYLQVRYPAGRERAIVEALAKDFGDEVIFHLEYQRRGGAVFVSSLPLVRFTTPERLEAIVAHIEEAGASLADPHTYRLDDAGWKRIDAPQAEFRRLADPHGLMNPGKLAI